jgi:hypothetical protein
VDAPKARLKAKLAKMLQSLMLATFPVHRHEFPMLTVEVGAIGADDFCHSRNGMVPTAENTLIRSSAPGGAFGMTLAGPAYSGAAISLVPQSRIVVEARRKVAKLGVSNFAAVPRRQQFEIVCWADHD